MRRDRAATAAPVEKPASVAAKPRHRFDFAREVSNVLAAALARDDERRRRVKHCPHCGHSLLDNLS